MDRLALVSDAGTAIGEDYTLALATRVVLRHRSGPVVTNLSTSRIVDDMAAERGARVIRAPVGEVNVALRMRQEGAVIGGEGNGGVILPEVHLGRDAATGIALIRYSLAKDRVRPQGKDVLLRSERSALQSETATANTGLMRLAPGIEQLQLRFFDGSDWRDDWDAKQDSCRAWSNSPWPTRPSLKKSRNAKEQKKNERSFSKTLRSPIPKETR